jgi:hypothetical protein
MSFPTYLTRHSQLDCESILDSRFRENDKNEFVLFTYRLLNKDIPILPSLSGFSDINKKINKLTMK